MGTRLTLWLINGVTIAPFHRSRQRGILSVLDALVQHAQIHHSSIPARVLAPTHNVCAFNHSTLLHRTVSVHLTDTSPVSSPPAALTVLSGLLSFLRLGECDSYRSAPHAQLLGFSGVVSPQSRAPTDANTPTSVALVTYPCPSLLRFMRFGSQNSSAVLPGAQLNIKPSAACCGAPGSASRKSRTHARFIRQWHAEYWWRDPPSEPRQSARPRRRNCREWSYRQRCVRAARLRQTLPAADRCSRE